MAIYEDVTQSPRTQLATRMSEQIFRAIANYDYDWEVWAGPNGRVLWMNPAAPLRDKNGAIMGGVEIATDLSRQKRAREALEDLSQESLEAPVHVNDPPAQSS
ncbi:MAG: hypothetical protein MUC88_10220 [Planctomycetes bacterium]|nr:hypothetical protein [Planctomycetota bacterium]